MGFDAEGPAPAPLGGGGSGDQLVRRVFSDLHDVLERRAKSLMGSERADHTLDTGALLSEAWLRLQGYENLASATEGDVVAAATNAMRRVLVDHARGRTAEKRGGPDAARLKQTLRTADLAISLPDDALLDLETALTDLGSLDQDLLRVVELRYFAGLSVERVAELLARSPRSIKRDWAWARAWLFRRLTGAGS